MDVRSTIRKLLAVATNDAATEGEIENAMRAAESLMMAHRISQADLEEATEAIQEEIRYARHESFTTGVKLSRWETSLAWFVCEFVGTVQWYFDNHQTKTTPAGAIVRDEKGYAKKATKITFYGPDDDVLAALELFEELSKVIASMSQLRFGGTFRGPGRSYSEGFVVGLDSKLQVVRQQLTSDSQSRALVVRANELVTTRKKEASKWLREVAGVRLGSPRGSGNGGSHHASAYSQGITDGKSTDVSKRDSQRRLTR